MLFQYEVNTALILIINFHDKANIVKSKEKTSDWNNRAVATRQENKVSLLLLYVRFIFQHEGPNAAFSTLPVTTFW